MPKVSIIIPVYNTAKYLEQCLDSILNQTLQDFEIICINDGSTDSSVDILKKYQKKDSRFIIIDKKNEGQGIARNSGIKIAKGEYLLCMDSDDWLENSALEEAYNKIKSDNTDFMFFSYYRYIEKTDEKYYLRYTSVFKNFGDKPFTLKQAIKNIFFPGCPLLFKIYKTKFLQENHIEYSSHKFMEDAPFYLSCIINVKSMSTLSKPLYNYRIYEKSSTFNFKECVKSLYEINEVLFNRVEKITDKAFLDAFLLSRKQSLIYFFDAAPFFYKRRYYDVMQKIIRNFIARYGLDEDLQQVMKMNWLSYWFDMNMKKSAIALKTHFFV